jgi:hypothetical protein
MLSLKSYLTKLYKTIVKRDIFLAVLVVAVVVLTGLFLGWENNKIIPLNPDQLAHYTGEPSNPLKYLSNWDGPIYLRIASHGYTDIEDTGFFPFYPLVVSFVDQIVRSTLVSALIVSWASLVGAVYFYLKILKKIFNIHDNLEALKGVYFFILFPPAVVLIATYTESLFALLALGAIYFALNKKYLPAALLVMLSTATHIYGLFVLVLVAQILYEEKERLSKVILGAAIGVIGLVSYMLFLLDSYRNPLEFITAQKTNGWLHGGYFHRIVSQFSFFDLGVAILLLISIYYWWSRRKSFSVYSFLYLLIPILGGQFGGFSRYAIMVFPFQFMLFERIRGSKLLYPLSIGVLSIFWGYVLLQFAGGYTGV